MRFGDIDQWLQPDGWELLEQAAEVSLKLGQKYFRGPHIVLAGLRLTKMEKILLSKGYDLDDAVSWAAKTAERSSLQMGTISESVLDRTTSTELVTAGRRVAAKLGWQDILSAVFGQSCGFFEAEVVTCPFSFTVLADELGKIAQQEKSPDARNNLKAEVGTDLSTRVRKLDSSGRFVDNLSTKVRELSPAKPICRPSLVKRIASALCRFSRPNVFLVGESGVGKTALVWELASFIASDTRPRWMNAKEVFSVDCGAIAANSGFRGQLEENLQQIIDAATLSPGAILFLDDIHLLLEGSQAGSGALLGLFITPLGERRIQVIGSTTKDCFDSKFREHAAFLRRFEIIQVAEPSFDESSKIAEESLPSLSRHYGVSADSSLVAAAYRNAERFLPSQRFPSKLIQVLDGCMQLAREDLPNATSETATANLDHVLRVVSDESGVPISRINEIEHSRLTGLEVFLGERVFEQNHAVREVSRSTQAMRLGLANPKQVSTVLMFVGPPGTGKTEMAKALAEYLMGQESKLVRFNMSEFQTPESYQRLTGPPPGYVGYQEGGELTNKLLDNPYSVVLFDEIEKASPKVFDVLLQVFGDGHLTDNHGRIVNCRNSIFLMTSNALRNVEDWPEGKMKKALLEYSDGFRAGNTGPIFRPEFIDRLSVVPFKCLSIETLERIARRELERIFAQAKENGILDCDFEVEESVIRYLLELIDADRQGARPVQRLVQSEVAARISSEFLAGKIKSGREYRIQLNGERKIEILDSSERGGARE